MTAHTAIRGAADAWAWLAWCFYWGRLFWALSILGFAVGLIVVGDPVR